MGWILPGNAGTAYPQTAPGRAISTPPSSGWTTDPGITYSGAPCDAADALDGTGYIGLREPSPAAAAQITARHRAISAGAVVVARISSAYDSAASSPRGGLYLEGPSGVAHMHPIGDTGYAASHTMLTYPIGYTSVISSHDASPPLPVPWIRWDPAVGVEVSPDGIAWSTIHTAAAITGPIGGAPTRAGIVLYTGTTACSVALTSWEVA